MFLTTTVRLFTGSFKALFADFDAFIRICWAWYLLIAVLSVLALTFFADAEPVVIAAPIALVWLAASGSIAVAWHRNLLLRETPGAVNLHFGRRELRYIVKTFLIILILIVPLVILGVILGVIAKTAAPPVILFIGLGAVMLVLVLPVMMRVSLILPATALDETLSIGEAFRESKGLGLPMSLAAILLGLVVGGLDWLLRLAGDALGEGALTGSIAVFILSIALQIATTALQIGILTGGYYIFRERQTQKASRA